MTPTPTDTLLSGPATPAGLHTFPDGRTVHLRRLSMRQLQQLSEPLPTGKGEKLAGICERVNLVVCDERNRPLAFDASDSVAPGEVAGLIEAAIAANMAGLGASDELKKG